MTTTEHQPDAITTDWDRLPRIRDVDDLASYGTPTAAVQDKVLCELEEVHAEWIRAAPLVFVATASGSGDCDVSPKGDPAGLAHVLDPRTLAVPERAGNRRMDGFRNIIENPHAGLLFVVPGRPETLRVNGSARIVTDGPFFDDMVVKGHRPALVLLLHVEEVFFHCPRAFARSKTWRPQSWAPDAVRPYPEIAHALWRSGSSLAEVRRLYETADPNAVLYPTGDQTA